MRFDQHNLRETQPHRELLAKLGLEGRTVVDLGVGHPELAELILEHRPARLIECDDSVVCARAEKMPRDLSSGGLLPENCVVISNPPDEAVVRVLDVLDRSRVRDVVLMVDEKFAHELVTRGFEIMFHLTTDAFDPPLDSPHVVATRWATQGRGAR